MTDRHRSAITGKYVTAEDAKTNPDTTVRETRKAGKWRRRAEAAEAKLEAVREWYLRSEALAQDWPDAPDLAEVRAILDGTEEADR